MPVKLPCKDVWAVYRTAVLKYPLTKERFHDMMFMSRERRSSQSHSIVGRSPDVCQCLRIPRQDVTGGKCRGFCVQ